MNAPLRLWWVALMAIIVATTAQGDDQQFDAAVVYADASTDTVFNLFEYSGRQPVRTLCYIDKDARPQIPYQEIASIAFKRSEGDNRMIAITITLRNGSTKQGTLWFNDSFFATTKDGGEWRGRIVNLASLVVLPSKETGALPASPKGEGGR